MSPFKRLDAGSLPCELESSENPNWVEKSVGPCESLTMENAGQKKLGKFTILPKLQTCHSKDSLNLS